MTTIDGTFPDANGVAKARTGLPVEASRDGTKYHLTVDGVGRGTISMSNSSGTGRFRLLNDDLLDFAATRTRDGLQFRLHRLGEEIAKGVIRDLPP